MSETLEQKKRKFIEVLLTVGTLLGVITTFNHSDVNSTTDLNIIFAVSFFFFIVTTIPLYARLLLNIEDKPVIRRRTSGNRVLAGGTSAAFASLVVTASSLPVYDEIVTLLKEYPAFTPFTVYGYYLVWYVLASAIARWLLYDPRLNLPPL